MTHSYTVSLISPKKRLYTPHKIIKSPFCFIVYVNWNVRMNKLLYIREEKSKPSKTKFKCDLAGAVVKGSLNNVFSGCWNKVAFVYLVNDDKLEK